MDAHVAVAAFLVFVYFTGQINLLIFIGGVSKSRRRIKTRRYPSSEGARRPPQSIKVFLVTSDLRRKSDILFDLALCLQTVNWCEKTPGERRWNHKAYTLVVARPRAVKKSSELQKVFYDYVVCCAPCSEGRLTPLATRCLL